MSAAPTYVFFALLNCIEILLKQAVTALPVVTAWKKAKRKSHPIGWLPLHIRCWHYLFSRAVASQVLSARKSLTTVFGMRTGGPSPQSTPTIFFYDKLQSSLLSNGDPYEIRTRVAGVRGRSLRPLDQRATFDTPLGVLYKNSCKLILAKVVHHQGLEPGTPWLRVRCSTNWANGAYITP